jgi:5-methylcytosine-specific restriction endonuclease McrA
MTSLSKPVSRAHERSERLAFRKQVEKLVYRAVDARDQYRCRACGERCSPSATSLLQKAHRHHIRFRSAGGETVTANVVTVCARCHADLHAYRLTIEGDANKQLQIRRTEC